MNQKAKVILGIALFVLIMAGAYASYQIVSKRYEGKAETAESTAPQNVASSEASSLPQDTALKNVAPSDAPKEDGTTVPVQSANPKQENQQPATEAPSASVAPEEKVNYAPDFTVYDSAGNRVKLSDFRGRPVVVNFWASWCPPCKGEMPDFDTVYKQVKEDVVFLMVDLVDGKRETQKTGAAYVASQGYSFPVYFDTDYSAATAYGINAIPTTLFINKKGELSYKKEGPLTEQLLKARIDTIQ